MSIANTTVPDPGEDSDYGYTPTFGVCVTFLILFAISTLIHIGQAVAYRMWWLLGASAMCGIGETLGWAARLWSSKNVDLRIPFLIQISGTILSPTFLVAANFIILGQIIRVLGPQYSRLRPNIYALVFLTADVAALIVQAVGGAKASAALTLPDANRGARIMLGGILLQFVAIIIYVSLAAEFLARYFTDRSLRTAAAASPRPIPRNMKLMIAGLTWSTLFIFIRTIYRTIELQQGWEGRIITTQVFFNVLDGMPITVAMYTLNVLHPGWLIPDFSFKAPPPVGDAAPMKEHRV